MFRYYKLREKYHNNLNRYRYYYLNRYYYGNVVRNIRDLNISIEKLVHTISKL